MNAAEVVTARGATRAGLRRADAGDYDFFAAANAVLRGYHRAPKRQSVAR